MLREHIATKDLRHLKSEGFNVGALQEMLWYCEDGQIEQARKLLKRMRFERRLLHYCRKKAG